MGRPGLRSGGSLRGKERHRVTMATAEVHPIVGLGDRALGWDWRGAQGQGRGRHGCVGRRSEWQQPQAGSDNTSVIMTLMTAMVRMATVVMMTTNSHCLPSAWLCQSLSSTSQRQTFTSTFALSKLSGLGSSVGPSSPALHPSLHPGGWPVDTAPLQAPHPRTWVGATRRVHQQMATGQGTCRRSGEGLPDWLRPVPPGHTQGPVRPFHLHAP